MKVIDLKGNYVGEVRYTDGRDFREGDYIKFDKIYTICKRVWEASVGEITSLIVREVTINELAEDE